MQLPAGCGLRWLREVLISTLKCSLSQYHDDGQAEGLCFSVPPGVQAPSSLRNIYKELADDLGSSKFKKPNHGNLVKWAQQGILLLNTGLTVEAHKANSHKSVGWFNFTDAIIKAINKERKGVVFILWGAHAQAKAKFIDAARHHILKSVHPSGLSASKGFYGCKHFSKTNELLKKEGKKEIDWQV
jgi:uracil-DNA glycosylase